MTEQGRRDVTAEVREEGLVEEGDEVTLLDAAGRSGGEHARDEVAARLGAGCCDCRNQADLGARAQAAKPPCETVMVALSLAEEAPCGLHTAAGGHGHDARRPRPDCHGMCTVD